MTPEEAEKFRVNYEATQKGWRREQAEWKAERAELKAKVQRVEQAADRYQRELSAALRQRAEAVGEAERHYALAMELREVLLTVRSERDALKAALRHIEYMASTTGFDVTWREGVLERARAALGGKP